MLLAKNIEVVFSAIRNRKGYRFRRVVSFTAEKSWEKLTNTAEVVVSRNIKGYSVEDVKNLFRVGDPVAVRCGYNGELVEEFSGFITRIKDGQHIVFVLEDNMFHFKNGTINFTAKNAKLDTVIEQCLNTVKSISGYSYDSDVINAELGSVKLKNITPAEVLKKLKDDYNIYSCFIGDVLHVGKVYQGNSTRIKLSFDSQRNIKSHNIEFKRAEDLKVKIKVESVLSNGQKKSVTVGDENGELSTIQLYGISNESDLKKKAEEKLALKKVDGLTGSVVLFGIPKINFGDEVELVSTEFPDRNGVYYIDSTVYRYGPSAQIEREIKIGGKAR